MGRQVSAETSPEDLLDLYRALAEADDLNDTVALARIGWQLYSMACATHQARSEAAGLVGDLCAAARAAVAGHGSPASLTLLREVLARHGWLPPPGATPLQMIAAPRAEVAQLVGLTERLRLHHGRSRTGGISGVGIT